MSLPKKGCDGKWRIVAGRFYAQGKSKGEVIQAALKELEERASHEERGYVVCNDGTVLAIYWEYGSYGYDIVHPGERVADDGVIKVTPRNMGEKTYSDVIQRAKVHADQCYGGIVPKQTN